MSFVRVTGETILEWIQNFQTLNIHQTCIPDTTCNFVLIQPALYCGSYGGLFRKEIVEAWNHPAPFWVVDLLAEYCMVWWTEATTPPIVGDLSFSKDGRVAVPTPLFARLKVKKQILQEGYSSYYR